MQARSLLFIFLLFRFINKFVRMICLGFKVPFSKNYFYLIIVICSFIIFFECLESIVVIKGFNEIYNLVYEEEASSFLTFQFVYFFIKVIPMMVLGIYSYFSFLKKYINKMSVYLFFICVSVVFIYSLAQGSVFKNFYYLKLVGYLILIIVLVKLFISFSKESRRGV